MTQAMLNSMFLAMFGMALTFVTTWFWKSRESVLQKARALEEKAQAAERERVAERKTDQARITELETKLLLVSEKVVPISTAFQAILIKELTHFHTPEMDGLMEKIGPPNTLTPTEEKRLAVLLRERSKDVGPEVSESERNAALILPAIIKRAKEESDIQEKANQLQWGFVAVPERRHTLDMALALKPAPAVDSAAASSADTPTAAESLAHIDENTAKTAESLAVLNQRATEKLSTIAARRGLAAEHEQTRETGHDAVEEKKAEEH